MVDKIPSMVSMEMNNKEKTEYASPSPPKYPYGLCLSLCEDELKKLDINKDDIGVGDMLHIHCLTRVTSVSSNENEDGEHVRVELQVTHIAAESEDEENKKEKKSGSRKLYR